MVTLAWLTAALVAGQSGSAAGLRSGSDVAPPVAFEVLQKKFSATPGTQKPPELDSEP